MIEVKEPTIGQFTYKIQQLGAKTGTRALTRLMKMCAPLGGAPSEEQAFAAVIAAVNDADIEYLCTVFAACTRISPLDNPGVEVPLSTVFDSHFAGKYGDMLKWLWASVEVNFTTFIEGLGYSPAAMAQVMGNRTSTPMSSSGVSSMPGTGR